jgi:hypothetical protein
MSIVKKIEDMPTLSGDKPEKDVTIKSSAHEKVQDPFAVHKEDAKEEL